MPEAISLNKWRNYKRPIPDPNASFQQTNASHNSRQRRDELNALVEAMYKSLSYEPLPDRSTSPEEYLRERAERMLYLKGLCMADCAGKFTENDWTIALANAVR